MAKLLVAAMGKSTDRFQLIYLADALGGLAEKLPEGEAADEDNEGGEEKVEEGSGDPE